LLANFGGFNIVKVDPAKKVSIFADGLAYQPLYIDHKPSGGFYYSSYEYSSYGQYTPFGINSLSAKGVVERLTSSTGRLNGVAVNSDGLAYVVNSAENKLYQLASFALDTAQLANFATETARASNYFLARYKDGTTDNIVQAMRLTGLAEARKVITDTALQTQVDAAITTIGATLRTRQRVDGGWGKTTGNVSDAMVTALVGLAIDYTNPSADDPVVRKAIQYLLNTQQADRSWVSNNGVLSTRLASTSLVVAYLPVALERLGGIDVDLHVNFPASVLLNNPVPAPTSQTANANGGIDYYWKLLGVTANKRSLDFDLTLKNMVLKEQRAVADAAYIEFENSFSTEKLRVNLDIPTVKAASGLALTLTTDRNSYTANDSVLVRPVVSNTGPTIANGSVETSIRAVGSTEALATLAPLSVPSLAVGANLALETPWNTGTTLTGHYEAFVRLLDAQGRVVDESTAPFQITAGVTALIDGKVVTDKPVYAAWDTVNIDARVQNITKNAIQAPTRVEMTVTTPDGRVILNETANLGELVPNALRDLQFSLNLADAVTGDYPVQMTVKDAFSRATLITRATVFHVERLAIQALNGNVVATPVQVLQGEPASCLETVQNKAASPITGAVLTSKLVSAQTQDVLDLQTRNADFAANATLTETRPVATGNLAVGTYACVLMADLGGQSLQLGAALFDVLEPPIKINGSFEPGKRGRVLVLLDPGTGNDPLGPNHIPTMGVQRPYLEKLLYDAGWSYTIATDAASFTRELRTGGYVTYLLLPESVKLAETVQQEVREAVNRGEGLVEAGGHDQRQGRIDDALGLKFTGKHPRMTGISVNAGGFTPPGQLPLQLADKALRFTLDGATPLGQFIKDGQVTTSLSLAERKYGLGRTVHVGYDLLAEATLSGADSRHGQLLLDALSRVHPEPLVPYANSVYPLAIKLGNTGIATPGRVVLDIPANITVIDAGGATKTNGQLTWAFDLAKNASVDYTVWVRLPDVPITFDAKVESGSGGNYKIQRELALPVETLTANDLQAALDGIAPLTANAYKQARTALQQAQTLALAGNWPASLDALRTAADRLMAIATAEASTIRLNTDRALRSVAIKTVTATAP
jgi:Prenyltransferase and squalene oxidase repeat